MMLQPGGPLKLLRSHTRSPGARLPRLRTADTIPPRSHGRANRKPGVRPAAAPQMRRKLSYLDTVLLSGGEDHHEYAFSIAGFFRYEESPVLT